MSLLDGLFTRNLPVSASHALEICQHAVSPGALLRQFSEAGLSGALGPTRSPWTLGWLAPCGRRGGLLAVSPNPPELSVSLVDKFLCLCLCVACPMSRAEDLRKLATQFATLADLDGAEYSNVKRVMGVACLGPASGFGGAQRRDPPRSSQYWGNDQDGFVTTVPPAPALASPLRARSMLARSRSPGPIRAAGRACQRSSSPSVLSRGSISGSVWKCDPMAPPAVVSTPTFSHATRGVRGGS